ncbi:patatin-like phospholipase family protein [Brassicibacter mesophilus]|uniref:patatin-like phospholipase family protein n=1 Tax=Brassicibacter mesophilus TaxID=745119 RepID=UPI003D227B5D
MNGIFLQGGGAKGAFQAGVIYGLFENGLEFDIISGTSIGAINSYYIYSGNFEKMKKMWTEMKFFSDEINDAAYLEKMKVVENQMMIDALKDLDGLNRSVHSVYVNYVEIKKTNIEEVAVDITKLSKKDMLDSIKYSSLLPCRVENRVSLEEFVKNFDSKAVFDRFKEDLVKGEYDGYKLDGGILNNNFLNPFVKNKVDKLFIVVFKKDYEVPEYILNNYKKSDIVVIEPETEMTTRDTLRFEKEFCKKIFDEGYKIGKTIKY